MEEGGLLNRKGAMHLLTREEVKILNDLSLVILVRELGRGEERKEVGEGGEGVNNLNESLHNKCSLERWSRLKNARKADPCVNQP